MIKRTIELEHTTEANLRNVRTVLQAQMDRRERILAHSLQDHTDDALWAALFNFLVDLDTPGFEL